jgi:ring-1,2-phenylacetyl-CoA epoxidase subunit PaaE
MSPEGRFTPHLKTDRPARYVGVAAGSGITPMMALIAHTLRERPDDTFDLVYSNRTAMDAMFVDDLADLKDRWTARLGIHHVLTRERRSADLMSGRLDADRLRRIFTEVIGVEGVDEWFLCGPFELVQTCRDLLGSLGVDSRAVRYELFTTDRPERPAGQHGAEVPVVTADEVHRIAFRLDGVTSTVTSPVHSRETVLNAALRVRGDVPFACAGGVCGTCRARLVRGEVDMEENYALEPDEVAAGFVLTCQSVPVTPEVEVDYDT